MGQFFFATDVASTHVVTNICRLSTYRGLIKRGSFKRSDVEEHKEQMLGDKIVSTMIHTASPFSPVVDIHTGTTCECSRLSHPSARP